MKQLVSFEVRNHLRRLTANLAEAEFYRGVLSSDYGINPSAEKYTIISAKNMLLDGNILYNYTHQYELISYSKTYEAFLNAEENDAIVLCEWSIRRSTKGYTLQGRDYVSFDIIVPIQMLYATGPYIVTIDERKFLLDPILPYFANNISLEQLPNHLRPLL